MWTTLSQHPSTAVPLSQTAIELGWFYNCKNLKNIVIPDNITYIGEASFHSSGLESVTIPSSVAGMYHSAFWECESLQSVTINTNAITTYADYFTDCPIATVTYGAGVLSEDHRNA